MEDLPITRTHVHDSRTRTRGPDCEVPVRAGVPEPAPLEALLQAWAEARDRGLRPMVRAEKPGELIRLMHIAKNIRAIVRAGGDVLPVEDPAVVLAVCAELPREEQGRLRAKDIAARLAFTFWAKVTLRSPSLRASVVLEPGPDITLAPPCPPPRARPSTPPCP